MHVRVLLASFQKCPWLIILRPVSSVTPPTRLSISFCLLSVFSSAAIQPCSCVCLSVCVPLLRASHAWPGHFVAACSSPAALHNTVPHRRTRCLVRVSQTQAEMVFIMSSIVDLANDCISVQAAHMVFDSQKRCQWSEVFEWCCCLLNNRARVGEQVVNKDASCHIVRVLSVGKYLAVQRLLTDSQRRTSCSEPRMLLRVAALRRLLLAALIKQKCLEGCSDKAASPVQRIAVHAHREGMQRMLAQPP